MKGLIITCLGTMCMILCLFFIIVGFIYRNKYINYEETLQSKVFDTEIWNHGTLQRSRMYNDLIHNHIIVGMHFIEIDRLLGKTVYRRIYKDQICIDYYLGLIGDGLTHTSFRLIICADKNGKLVESIKLIGGHYGYFDKGKPAIIDEQESLKAYENDE